MDELQKLLENAGVREAEFDSRDHVSHSQALDWADEADARADVLRQCLSVLENVCDTDEAPVRMAIKAIYNVLGEAYDEDGFEPETFTTDDGREEPVSGRMSDDENYGVGGLIDQGR